MSHIFEGVCSALVTPFKGGKVDFEALERLIEFNLSGGVSAISVVGTTGEPSTLSDAEIKKIIKFCIKITKNRAKIIVGTGNNNTLKAIEMSKFASEAGADGLLVVTPYYNKCTQKGLEKYYFSIADEVSCPIIAYNVPSRTGVNIEVQTLCHLAQHKNIVGFKQANGNILQSMQIMQKLNGKIDFYSGDDALNYVYYALGAKGSISVTANAFPKETAYVYSAIKEGDYLSARAMQERLAKINELLFSQTNPIPIKHCLQVLGLCSNEVRPPLTTMTNTAKLENEVKKLTKKG